MAFRIRFLGTGTSVGVPQIGCDCAVCKSSDSKDRRRRSALYVQSARVAFLIDTPPELREAALAYDIRKVEAVVLTHAHMDHIAGFDDVRRFNTLNGDAPMRCLASAETIAAMHRIFPYITEKKNELGLFRPLIRFVPVAGTFSVGDLLLTPLEVTHGPKTYGYLIEDPADGSRMGYISDCHVIPEDVLEKLRGVDLMVLNCLRLKVHPTHLDFARSLHYLRTIVPRQARLIHMCHDISHADYARALAGYAGYAPAYDGEMVWVGSH